MVKKARSLISDSMLVFDGFDVCGAEILRWASLLWSFLALSTCIVRPACSAEPVVVMKVLSHGWCIRSPGVMARQEGCLDLVVDLNCSSLF